MKESQLDRIKALAPKTESIRNICIISHADHGKTSVVDNMLAGAGIIGFDQAGKKFYTDAGIDEQERGITIDSSIITFVFRTDVNSERKKTQRRENDSKKNDS